MTIYIQTKRITTQRKQHKDTREQKRTQNKRNTQQKTDQTKKPKQ